MISGPILQVGLTAGLFAALIALARIDRAQLRLPDRITLPLIAVGLVASWLGIAAAWPAALWGAAGGYAVLAGIGELYFRRHGQDGLGLGDAKLFAAAGAWLGWTALPWVLLLAATSALAAAWLRGVRPGQPVAFGPWLCAGFAVMWVAGLLGVRVP